MEREKIDLDTPLRELCFTLRTWHGIVNILDTRDVQTVWYLCTLTKKDLMRVRNFGKKSLYEVLDTLEEYDLWLGMSKEQLAEYEGKPLKKNEPQEELEMDNINWEERRWEIVARHLPDSRNTNGIWREKMDRVIDFADLWIKMYKERLEKERKHNT